MADPVHCKKAAVNYFYNLASAKGNTSRVTKGMVKRLKKRGIL